MSKHRNSIEEIAKTEAFYIVVAGHRATGGTLHQRAWGIPRESRDSVVAFLQDNFGAPFQETLTPVEKALELRRTFENDSISIEGGDS